MQKKKSIERWDTNGIILKGFTIGKRSVIGAGFVATKSIPDDELWEGNLARFIRKLNVEVTEI